MREIILAVIFIIGMICGFIFHITYPPIILKPKAFRSSFIENSKASFYNVYIIEYENKKPVYTWTGKEMRIK